MTVTVEQVAERPQHRPPADSFEPILPYLDSAEEEMRKASNAQRWADTVIRAADDVLAALPHSRDELLLRTDLMGDVARRVERLRRQRGHETITPANLITVPELAESIGVSDATVRTFLERGLIPGARKADPTKKRSRWLIPATAPDRYREGS